MTPGRWTRATSIGWLLGVPLIVVLALLGEAIGIGGLQVLVGAGMGLGVGLMQGRAVRTLGISALAWTLSCAIGLALPFLIADIVRKLGRDIPQALYVCVTAGGLVVGVWQASLLRPRTGRAGLWVVASTAGWALAAGTAPLADALPRTHALRGVGGALAFLGVVAVGGPILGVVTGVALSRMLADSH